MDEQIIIMLKNSETGFLEKEFAAITVNENHSLIRNIFAYTADGKDFISLSLTTDKELEDWEYDAVFDYYDTDIFKSKALSVTEIDGCENPVWTLILSYGQEIEQTINDITAAHLKELISVYEAISDKRNDYLNEE